MKIDIEFNFNSDSKCSSLFGMFLPFIRGFLSVEIPLSNQFPCLQFVSERTKWSNGNWYVIETSTINGSLLSSFSSSFCSVSAF